ncbi:hypothetical protein F5X96DRAFT_129983 [Biscogniauxia mediterranea]|nr:hypothetical protein F5X96DRAFT_129983 [Biscogniauxia mediterranea]
MMARIALVVLVLVTSTRALTWGSGGGPFGASTDGSGGWWDGSGSGSSSNSDSNGNGNAQGISSTAWFSLSDASFRSAGFDVAQAERLRDIHGILASVAFVALFPLGAVLMRCVPGRSSWAVHAAAQLLGYAVYAAAAGVGLYLVSEVRIPSGTGTTTTHSLLSDPRTNAHPIIGVVLLAALTLQPALGWLHHRRFARLGRRTAASHAHLWLGRAAVSLGIVNGGLGLGLGLVRVRNPDAVLAYIVLAVAMWMLWFVTAATFELRRFKGAAAAAWRRVEKSGETEPAPEEETTRVRMRGGGGTELQQQELQHVPPPRVVAGEDDMPSPPYTSGPLYEGQPVHGSHHQHGRGEAIGLGPMKSSVNRSDTVSSMSSYGTHRGQV